MALVKGTNSYLTLAEANAYFENRLDVDAWVKATDTLKTQALITATSQLDLLNWSGIAISDSQFLAFPRSGTFYDPKLGHEVSFTSDVPKRILDATCELAYHLLNNDGLLDDTGTVTDLQIGSISLNIKTNPSKIPSAVNTIILPLLLNGGTRTWWRAN